MPGRRRHTRATEGTESSDFSEIAEASALARSSGLKNGACYLFGFKRTNPSGGTVKLSDHA
jgi:hypothetical protein